ncbi:hypothetical protein ACIA8K_36835 [Catenuloplanes sp. NPDC051500]|uniref:hypothetical protein n=1 Tax=Catenuloplanes sp. NPDC051500 TaxID=3363959 RepID=UPI0037BE1162
MTEPFGFLLAFSGDDAGDIRFALSEGADALRWRVLRDSVRTTDVTTAPARSALVQSSDVTRLHAAGAVHTFRSENGVLVQERDGALVKHGIGDGESAIVFAGLGGRTWYLLAATAGGLRPYVTRNLAGGAWQPASPDGMPAGVRRGGVVTVTEDEFKDLESHA